MSSNLYNEAEFSQNELKHISGSIYKSFVQICLEFPNQTFVKVIELDGVTVKTFSQFYQDVIKLQSYLANFKESTLVTRNSNSYLHLVQIIAAMLSGKTLCIISPLDGEFDTTKKLESLPSDFMLLDNLECGDLLKSDLKSEQRLTEITPAKTIIQVFTSGSTGYNKVVCLSENNLLTNIEALIRHHDLQKNDIICTALPVFHVNTLGFSFLTSLLNGNQLILFNYFNIFDFYNEIRDSSVTIVSAIPTMIAQFIKGEKYFRKSELKQLKYFVSAATYLSVELLLKFHEIFGLKVVQGYGLSEAVNFSATMPVNLLADQHIQYSINENETCIGVELFGNQITIMDQNSIVLDEGAIGELCICGWNVMRGYLPEIDGIFPVEDTLRTGDLGYFKVIEGRKFFYLTGRKKDIVKIKGETVSLRQLDDLLNGLDSEISDGIAFGFQDEQKNENLGIVLKLEDEGLIDGMADRLKVFLSKHNKNLLPRIILLTKNSLRTASGKPLRWKYGKLIENEKPELPTNTIVTKVVRLS